MIPSWLANPGVCIVRTQNGFAIAPQLEARITECVVFETFAALTYYLDTQFVNAAPASP